MVRKYILKNGIRTAHLTRVVSKLIDFFIVLILSLLFYPSGLLVAISYLSVSDALQSGQSVGKKFMGFAVISLEDGTPCTYKQSLIRNLPFTVPLFLALIPFLGWILCVIVLLPLLIGELFFILKLESSNRWGDVMAGTSVIASTSDRLQKKVKAGWFDEDSQPATTR